MKILVVSNMYPGKSCPSAGVFVRRTCEQMKENGADVRLAVMRWRRGSRWKLWGYPLFYLSTVWKLLFSSYDLVYVHYASHSSPPVLWARRFRSFPIVTNVHGSDVIPSTRRQERFQRYTAAILDQSERVVVPSLYFREVVRQKYGIPAERIEVYPSGGVDRAIFYPFDREKRAQLRRMFGLEKNCVTFAFAGRMIQGKGYDILLKAIRILEDRGHAANYLLVGDGEDSGVVAGMIAELGLEEKIIRFPLLAQEKLAEIYNVADAFVFPTMREAESLGLAALEAMACGTPVIGSDFAAPRYYIRDGENGYRFPAGDAQALAERMAGVIEERDPLEELRRGALATAEEYSSESCGKILKRILQDVWKRIPDG